MSWGYSARSGGPQSWAKKSEHAVGSKQSPINIDTSKLRFDDALLRNPLHLSQSFVRNAVVKNTGHGFQVAFETDAMLTGGPLSDNYVFSQLHAHWGSGTAWGSEHQLNGQPHSGELHIVFWNRSKYASLNQAMSQKNGMAVLAIWIKERSVAEFAALKPIIDCLKLIRFKDDSPVALDCSIDLNALLPDKPDLYFTYEGSLTTPPCYESVTWIVFRNAISLSHNQLHECRRLMSSRKADEEQEECVDIFRPVCPLGSRIVRTTQLT